MRGAPWRSIVALTLTTGALLGAPAYAAPPGGGERAPATDARVPPSPHSDPALRTHAAPRAGAHERRSASRSAYTQLNRAEAVELAQRHFPALNQRGYQALDLEPGERVDAWLGAR